MSQYIYMFLICATIIACCQQNVDAKVLTKVIEKSDGWTPTVWPPDDWTSPVTLDPE
jgi:hypothetical protein